MSDIVVNTDQLRLSAEEIQRAAASLEEALSKASSASSVHVADKYEGQFSAKVSALVADARTTGNHLTENANSLQKELIFRADGFDAANEAGASAMLQPSVRLQQMTSNSPTLDLFAALRKLGIDSANVIWHLAGFAGGAGFGAYVTTIARPETLDSLVHLEPWEELMKYGLLSRAVTQRSTNPGEFIVTGRDIPFLGRKWYKKWVLDEKPNLTLIKGDTLVDNVIADADSISKSGPLQVAMLGAQTVTDWEKYHASTLADRSSILATDSMLAAVSVAAFIGGTALTAPVLGPAAPIGGVVTAMAVDWAFNTPITTVLPAVGASAGNAFGGNPLFYFLGKTGGEAAATWLLGPEPTDITLKDAAMKGMRDFAQNAGELLRNNTPIDTLFEKCHSSP